MLATPDSSNPTLHTCSTRVSAAASKVAGATKGSGGDLVVDLRKVTESAEGKQAMQDAGVPKEAVAQVEASVKAAALAPPSNGVSSRCLRRRR